MDAYDNPAQPSLSTQSSRLGVHSTNPGHRDHRFHEMLPRGQVYDEDGGVIVDPWGGRINHESPIMKELLKVEHCKRLASYSLSNAIASNDTDTDKDERLDDLKTKERNLAKSRVALLNMCLTDYDEPNDPVNMRVQPHANPLQDTGRSADRWDLTDPRDPVYRPRTCITYRRFIGADVANREEIQDPISWSTDTDFTSLLDIVRMDGPNTNMGGGQTDTVATKIKKIYNAVSYCPSNKKTEVALKLVAQASELHWRPESRLNSGLDAAWAFPESKTEPWYTWKASETGQINGTHEVIVGPMNINTCREYDNPDVNKTVQEIILFDSVNNIKGAREHAENLSIGFLNIHLSIKFHGENHVFQLAPYSENDHCLVSHLCYIQHNVHTNVKGHKGLLDVNDVEKTTYHTIFNSHDNATIPTTRQACIPYYCLGASRSVRWGEDMLSKVHSAAYRRITTNFPTLPDPDGPDFITSGPKQFPKARVVRIPFLHWDIYASSYLDERNDSVTTLITGVHYPPYMSHQATRTKPIKIREAPGNRSSAHNGGTQDDFFIKLMFGDEDRLENRLYFQEDPLTDGSVTESLHMQFKEMQGTISRGYTHEWDNDLRFFDNIARIPAALAQWREYWGKIVKENILASMLYQQDPNSTRVYINNFWYADDSRIQALKESIRRLVPPAQAEAYIHYFSPQDPGQGSQSRLASSSKRFGNHLTTSNSRLSALMHDDYTLEGLMHKPAMQNLKNAHGPKVTHEEAVQIFKSIIKKLNHKGYNKKDIPYDEDENHGSASSRRHHKKPEDIAHDRDGKQRSMIKSASSLQDGAESQFLAGSGIRVKAQDTSSFQASSGKTQPEWDALQTRIKSMEARLKASSSRWGPTL